MSAFKEKIDIVSLFELIEFEPDKYVDIVRAIGDMTAIRYDKRGKPFRRNYERGLLLIGLAKAYRPKRFLEFGTGRGFGCGCVSICESVSEIYTIDKLKEEATVGTLKQTEHCRTEKIRFIQANTFNLDTRRIPGQFELIFIDGEHTEKAVRNDFNIALSKISENGIIVFDDYRKKHAGVRKYIKSLKYPKTLVYTDGWFYENRMISKHGDADKVIDGKEYGSGQVIIRTDAIG